MDYMTKSLSPDIENITDEADVFIKICDKFGSIDSQLLFDPYNYEITK